MTTSARRGEDPIDDIVHGSGVLGDEIDGLIREIHERTHPRLDGDGVAAVHRLVEPLLERHGARWGRSPRDREALARELRELAASLPPRRTSRS